MFTRTSSLATFGRSLNFTRRSSGASQFRQNETTPDPNSSRALAFRVQHLEAFTFDSPELALTAPRWRCFSTRTLLPMVPPPLDRTGFGHIAFAVPSVPFARDEVLAAGGSSVGDIVTLEASPDSRVTWCYVRDPEGNIIELQSWA